MSWSRRQAGVGLLGVGLALSAVGGYGAAQVAAGSQGAQQPAAPAVVPPPPITDGPTLFRERGCAQCHEIRGTGGHKGPDLSGVGRRMKKDALLKQIEQGGDAMPAFGGVIEENEIAALVKYLGKCRDKTKSKKIPVVAAPSAELAE